MVGGGERRASCCRVVSTRARASASAARAAALSARAASAASAARSAARLSASLSSLSLLCSRGYGAAIPRNLRIELTDRNGARASERGGGQAAAKR